MGLTEWSREWATRWLERFGRRFATYRVRSDKGRTRGPQQGTDRSVVVRRNASVKRLLDSQPAEVRQRARQTSLVGPRLSKAPNLQAKDKLIGFVKDTTRKRAALRLQRSVMPEKRTGQILGPPAWYDQQPGHGGQYKVIDGTLSAVDLPGKKNSVVVAWKAGQVRDFKGLKGAHYVVVDSVSADVHMASSHLDQPRRCKIVLLLGMVGFGLSAVSRQQYAALKFQRPGGDVLKHKPAIYHTVADLLVTPSSRTRTKSSQRLCRSWRMRTRASGQ